MLEVNMDFKVVNRSVESVMKEVKSGKLSLELDIQRPVGAYSPFGKSMFIDSLLRGYPIGIIYVAVVEDENKKKIKYISDGNQRIGNLRDFIIEQKDKKNYKLSSALAPVIIDGEKYEIAGKRYADLDEAVQTALNDSLLMICEIRDYTKSELNDFYSRINSGKALNSTQKLLPLMSDKMLTAIKDLTDNDFFGKALTKKQLINSTDVSTVLEAMMLCEFGDNFEINSFRNNDKIKYIDYFSNHFNEDMTKTLTEALEWLDMHFEKKVKIAKTALSLIVYGTYEVIKEGKDLDAYFTWLDNFIKTYQDNEEFLQYCKQGTTNSANVVGRLNYFNAAIETFLPTKK